MSALAKGFDYSLLWAQLNLQGGKPLSFEAYANLTREFGEQVKADCRLRESLLSAPTKALLNWLEE
ncbi:MAG: hypothetical protein IPL70_14490 [Uliginosibacterium sp.]|nr:hypothetical protein [Uliginosibacterium sp.]